MEDPHDELDRLRRMEQLLHGRNRVLKQLARGAPMSELLETLCREGERTMPGARCSLLVLDPDTRQLRHAAAPSLSPDYVCAIDGTEIGPTTGCCGAAAYLGERVVIDDVTTHPNWQSFRELAQEHQIKSCWSEPILSTRGLILGTLAVYYQDPRTPQPFELETVTRIAQVASVAIENEQAKIELRASEQRFRQVTESIREVFWLTDGATGEVLYISPAYEDIWGRSCQSVLEDAQSWYYDIHPEDRDRVESLARAEDSYETEFRIVRPDGTQRWIFERCFPVHDSSGRIYRFAGISEDVTDRKLTEKALRDANRRLDAASRKKLQSLTTELLLAEERERRKLAVDLHDTLNQILVLARMKVAELQKQDESAPPSAEALSELAGLLDEATGSARSMTFQLSPPILYDLGFVPAVQWLVENIEESYGLRTRLLETQADLPLDDRVEVLLYRAVRELLINVAKHARAEQAIVSVVRAGETIEICVRDNGVAFDPADTSHRGLGLDSIQERLENLGGHMSIDARPGFGTRITLVAPLATDATDPEPTSRIEADEADRRTDAARSASSK